MNQTYQTLAGRTECDQRASAVRMMAGYNTTPTVVTGTILNGHPQLTPIRVTHSIIGLVGEIGEIGELRNVADWEKINQSQMILEIGDALWYIAEGCNALGFDMDSMVKECRNWASGIGPQTLSILAGKLCSELQRWIFYGKYESKPDELKTNLRRLYQRVILALHWLIPKNQTLETIQQANVEKLKVRYPDKYSDWHAADENRDRLREELHVTRHEAQNKAFGEQYGQPPVNSEAFLKAAEYDGVISAGRLHPDVTGVPLSESLRTLSIINSGERVVQDGHGFGHKEVKCQYCARPAGFNLIWFRDKPGQGQKGVTVPYCGSCSIEDALATRGMTMTIQEGVDYQIDRLEQ